MLALVTGRSHRQDRAMPCVRFAPCGDRRPDEGERRRLGYPPRQNQTRPRVPVEPSRYFRGPAVRVPAERRHSRYTPLRFPPHRPSLPSEPDPVASPPTPRHPSLPHPSRPPRAAPPPPPPTP